MAKTSQKKAHKLTTHEAMHRIFGPEATKHLRELAKQERPPRKARKSLKTKSK